MGHLCDYQSFWPENPIIWSGVAAGAAAACLFYYGYSKLYNRQTHIERAKMVEAEFHISTDPDELPDNFEQSSERDGYDLIAFIAIKDLMNKNGLVEGQWPDADIELELSKLAYQLREYEKSESDYNKKGQKIVREIDDEEDYKQLQEYIEYQNEKQSEMSKILRSNRNSISFTLGLDEKEFLEKQGEIPR